uniref:H15 domain-containing protein n=1 Tax=Medicago truncatula TaxID=3880 RepID=I3SSF0_MEDTR|nr:unknown [Medicago truncatula]
MSTSKEQISRLDSLIFDSIVKLKEPKGSDIAAIAAYIEDQYRSPPNLIKLLSTKLKHMVASGKLVKVNHKYRIATNSTKTSEKRRCSSLLLLEGRPKDSPKAEKTDANVLSKSQIDVELLKMRGVTAQEVAAAAKAVAEAEAAIAEAETAAREAETAEAEAEAARVFAKAATKALKCRRLNI